MGVYVVLASPGKDPPAPCLLCWDQSILKAPPQTRLLILENFLYNLITD